MIHDLDILTYPSYHDTMIYCSGIYSSVCVVAFTKRTYPLNEIKTGNNDSFIIEHQLLITILNIPCIIVS